MSDDDDEILFQSEHESRLRLERVRGMLMESGRPDLVKQLDDNLREIRLGLYGARMAWHSISTAQRNVLLTLSDGGIPRIPRRTAMSLIKRGLIEQDGAWFVLTERGRFVVSHKDG